QQEFKRVAHVLVDHFGLQVTPRRQPDGLQLYITGRSFERFSDLVLPHLIPEMRYKMPLPRRTTCLKSNGGAQRFPQAGWKSAAECIGTRELDCEAYTPSRDESRAK